jgi:hypothetical protein
MSDASDPNARGYVILHSNDPGVLKAYIAELERENQAMKVSLANVVADFSNASQKVQEQMQTLSNKLSGMSALGHGSDGPPAAGKARAEV